MANRKSTIRCLAVLFAPIIICGAVFALSPFGRILFLLVTKRHMSVRERITISLPDGIHAIEHSRIGINPIVAEYSRDVTFLTDHSRGRTTPLAIDTCGGYPINCYVVETPNGQLLRLDDALSEHLLDLQTQTTYLIRRVGDVAYIGKLSDERTCSGMSITNGDPSTLSVTIGDHAATPIAELIGDAKERYLGMITGGFGNLRFVPASEEPEPPIRKMGDR